MARRYVRDSQGRFAATGTVRLAKTEKALVSRLERAHPGLQLSFHGGREASVLSRIVVPKEARGQGTGSRAMRAITNFADRKGRNVALSPSSDFGGSKKRLTEFYGRFGFKKNKDLAVSETMLREPRRRRR